MKRLISAHTLKTKAYGIFRFFLLVGLGYIILYPMLYMLSMSFRDTVDIYDVSVKWIPKTFTVDNITKISNAIDYPKTLLYTLAFSIFTSLILVFVCSMTAYGLSRFEFKGRELIFATVLLIIVVPQQFFVLPQFLRFRYFDFFGASRLISLFTGEPATISLLDTPLTFLLPAIFGIGIRSGLYIFIFRQFFRSMPKELEESSAIDGCGPLKTFLVIVIPNAMPAFVTTFLFSFVWHWNDYQLSSMFLSNMRTLSAYLVNITGYIYKSNAVNGVPTLPDTNQIMVDIQAASFMVVVPVVIIYIVLQRYFTESIERTGLVE